MNLVTKTMSEMGFTPKRLGYRATADIVEMILSGEIAPGLITKIGYPTLAKRYSTTSNAIERNIRYSIDRAWTYYQDKFDILLNIRYKPTNSEFVFGLAHYIEEHQENPF